MPPKWWVLVVVRVSLEGEIAVAARQGTLFVGVCVRGVATGGGWWKVPGESKAALLSLERRSTHATLLLCEWSTCLPHVKLQLNDTYAARVPVHSP